MVSVCLGKSINAFSYVYFTTLFKGYPLSKPQRRLAEAAAGTDGGTPPA